MANAPQRRMPKPFMWKVTASGDEAVYEMLNQRMTRHGTTRPEEGKKIVLDAARHHTTRARVRTMFSRLTDHANAYQSSARQELMRIVIDLGTMMNALPLEPLPPRGIREPYPQVVMMLTAEEHAVVKAMAASMQQASPGIVSSLALQDEADAHSPTTIRHLDDFDARIDSLEAALDAAVRHFKAWTTRQRKKLPELREASAVVREQLVARMKQ